MTSELFILVVLVVVLGRSVVSSAIHDTSWFSIIILGIAVTPMVACGLYYLWLWLSPGGKALRKRRDEIKATPKSLLGFDEDAVFMGLESDLKLKMYLPDSIRSRHVHILGATGSGKTESVVLNFLIQDVRRKLGAIVLDAKGDTSFLTTLRERVPHSKLKVFDLSDPDSLTYDPLEAGSPLESAQRLFASLVWSEEYYKSKAFSALQRIFQIFHERHERNPSLLRLSSLLGDKEQYSGFTQSDLYPTKVAEQDFQELSGLRDQIKTLTMGHLGKILSPDGASQMRLEEAKNGCVLYFRLQSLLSSQLVSIVGKLLINHLNFIAGMAHRAGAQSGQTALVPCYLDEFASFACPEFADLISKARSARIALHFSHQSIGDLTEVSEGFINRITDNSATKIVLRINDPDSAEYFARSFGTKIYQKITQRITNVKRVETAEVVGEGTQREAHQFRASPDLFKTLPTGVGSVLIAHGEDSPNGASSVFKIRFPKLEPKNKEAKLV